MKILAVIPARAGSKGIPNKNIRIVAGHPLIYYSINNAKKSKYISDIIVTTDSEEVKIISKQMGVEIKERDRKLCGDMVTLDSVVYDAIPKNKKWDYIITMQPTSPTLSVETLDNAIEFAIANDLDTLISAINSPHLSWRDDGGRKVPNYVERLNRQYLPPNYLETGAFVISKYNIVTSNSRIGSKIDVFEIPEEESQDVDTFDDLICVERALTSKKVAFYVNGNNDIGLGHIYRVLELADEFYCKPTIYYDKKITDITFFGNTTHNLVGVNGNEELFSKLENEKYNIFINDILSTDIKYMQTLKKYLPNAKIINFEDDGEGSTLADVVFNALYSESSQVNMLSGKDYYVCGKSFLFYNPIVINEKVKNVLITFGGADPQNYTDRIFKIICKKEYDNYNFTVVLGRAKKNVNELLKYNKHPNINVLFDVKNMAEIMHNNDIAITSRGRTGYELAILGIPTISMAQNSREEKHGFMNHENGFSYIGLNPPDEIIEGTIKTYLNSKRASRQNIQNKLLKSDLMAGRKRIMSIIDNL